MTKIQKAVKKWNEDLWAINEISKLTDRLFYWKDLVWQEIRMYIAIGEIIDLNEFDVLCVRRGFNECEANYLKEMLTYIKLYKK